MTLETAWTATTRSLLAEQDIERARLRGRIYELERALQAAGEPVPGGAGERMASGYRTQARAIDAVLSHFGGYSGLPEDLRAAFRPLVIT